MNFVPPEVIETRRLRLRRPERADASAIFEYASDPEVARLMDWKTVSDPSEVASSIETREKEWASGGPFTWIITVTPRNLVAGGISCFPHGHHAEIGYVLNRRYWGNGYATEASERLLKLLFDDAAVWRVWATCDVENLASIRVLEKIGMRCEGRLRRLIVRPNLGPEPRDAFIYAKVRE